MKTVVGIILLLLIVSTTYSQKKLEKNIPYNQGQRISMDFTYPQLIKVQTWKNQEIKIEGEVSINSGINDDAFEIEVDQSGNAISVTSIIKDKDNLPKRITVQYKGEKYVFQASGWDDPKVKEFMADKKSTDWVSFGLDIDIDLVITVPENSELSIFSKFGLIEIHSIPQIFEATSKHNGVDISVMPSQKLDFDINTKFGEVYTNLDLAIDKQNGLTPYKAQKLIAHLNGGGQKVYLESKFGNVYLRKKE